MQVADPTTIIKILLDLDIDLDNLSSEEDYLSALLEGQSAIEFSTKGKGDPRSEILRSEILRVRNERKPRVRRTKITAESFKPRVAPRLVSSKISAPSLQPTQVVEGESSSISVGFLQQIRASLNSIINTLALQNLFDRKDKEKQRIEGEEADAQAQEDNLESKRFEGVRAVTSKVLAPVQNVFSRIFQFLQAIFFGRIVFKLLEWFGDPKNARKIQALGNFLKNFWPAIVGSALLFGTSLGRMVTMLTVKAVASIPKLLIFAKALGAFIAANPLAAAAAVGIGALSAYGIKRLSQENVKEETQGFAGGGKVRGTDTIPAMLTPGEFVMSRGAVQKYGADTLAAMNAAGGGTNKPKMLGGTVYAQEGGDPTTGFDGRDYVNYLKSKPEEERNLPLTQVNAERAMQGLPELDKLTYAPGVEPIQRRGPRPKINETSDTFTDFNRGVVTTSRSKTVDDKLTDFGFSARRTTEEDKIKAMESMEKMGIPLMELFDGRLAPDVGQIVSNQFESVMKGIDAMPNEFKEEASKILKSGLNRLIPGSTEQVLGDLGDEISAAGRVQKFNKGGKVKDKNKKTTSMSMKRNVSNRFDMKTGKFYINNQEVGVDEYNKFINLSQREKIQQYGQVKDFQVEGNEKLIKKPNIIPSIEKKPDIIPSIEKKPAIGRRKITGEELKNLLAPKKQIDPPSPKKQISLSSLPLSDFVEKQKMMELDERIKAPKRNYAETLEKDVEEAKRANKLRFFREQNERENALRPGSRPTGGVLTGDQIADLYGPANDAGDAMDGGGFLPEMDIQIPPFDVGTFRSEEKMLTLGIVPKLL